MVGAIGELSSPAGKPTNCIYGFIKMLAKMESRVEPTHLVVVWDAGLSPVRTALLPGYKAQRPEAPVGLNGQVEELQAWLPLAGKASLAIQGCEADDIIADIAKFAARQGFEVVIASSDKDFMQLVGGAIRMLNPNDKSETLWGVDEVVAKMGVKPSQIVDFLCLVGDTVDNIPGAPGIGPKTAQKLLAEHGDLEAVIAAASTMTSERLRDAISSSAPNLLRNRQLISLHSVDQSFETSDFRLRQADDASLRLLYAEWGFKSLGEEVEKRNTEQTLLSV